MTDLGDFSLFYLALVGAVIAGVYIADFLFDQYKNHKLARRLVMFRSRLRRLFRKLKGIL